MKSHFMQRGQVIYNKKLNSKCQQNIFVFFWWGKRFFFFFFAYSFISIAVLFTTSTCYPPIFTIWSIENSCLFLLKTVISYKDEYIFFLELSKPTVQKTLQKRFSILMPVAEQKLKSVLPVLSKIFR